MATRTRSSSGAAAPSPRKLKQQKVWDVTPSEFSQLCANPIRKIVDNIKKPENTDKTLIPLSLGTFAPMLSMKRMDGYTSRALIKRRRYWLTPSLLARLID